VIVGTWRPPPIRDYGLVGDSRTAALISKAGSIDWMCWPRFDSEPVFGRLIDPDHGGHFEVTVLGSTASARAYRDSSAVLDTRFTAPSGEATLSDAMVMGSKVKGLVRHLTCHRGRVQVRLLFNPRSGLPGRSSPTSLFLITRPGPQLPPAVPQETWLEAGQSLSMLLADGPSEMTGGLIPRLIEATDRWWRRWSDEIHAGRAFHEVLVRSLINLRLLTYTPTGAPVAAPTTSLPEVIGGERNWDYRYSWPRDASVGVAAFLAVGKRREAREFVRWLVTRACSEAAPIRVLYDLEGKRCQPEREVAGVAGYLGSRPVRVGNLAEDQHQLDVYGWVIDALWNLVDADRKLGRDGRRALREYADFVCQNWSTPDAGLWEVRDEPAHYVHSKVWAWIALDRAARAGRLLRMKGTDIRRWETERDRLADDVRQRGFSSARDSYTRAYGSGELDSALLLLPLTGFDGDGERLEGTVNAIWRELGAGDPLLYRYPPGHDGLPGTEGAFLPCTFWLVEGLLRLGRREEALKLFDQVLGLANELLLLPEEIDPSTGDYLGNYPLALSQAGLVHAVLEVQKVLDG
jgi:GH15 family glucan-1,4-alpha-glucosidase